MGTEAWIADKDGHQLDLTTRLTLPTETYRERLVIAGKAFRAVDTAAVGMAGVKEYLLTTPNTTTRIHLISNALMADDDGTYLFTEAPTLGAGGAGAAVAAQNKDRNSATAATLVVTEDPDIATDGTTLYSSLYGWWPLLSSADVLILKQNTMYMIRWTDAGAGSNIVYMADWAEV